VLIAAVPQHPWLWSRSDDLSHHVRRYRMGEIEGKAKAAGFSLSFADSFTSLLLPVMAVSRRVDRVAKSEFGIPPTLDRLMSAVLSLEHAARRAGLRCPVGGSRVIVARKR
jgi:hypothetical protein